MTQENQDPISFCNDALQTATNKEEAFEYAKFIEKHFMVIDVTNKNMSDEELFELSNLRSTVLAIVATIYVWNDQLELAQNIDSEFIYNKSLWEDEDNRVIDIYLIHLIIKKQISHLKTIFKNESFRKNYLHYEDIFMSVVDPKHEFKSNGGVFVNYVNRTNAYSRLFTGKNIL